MIARLSALALLACSSPLVAVGLGPLAKSGLTDGDRKAFWLTLINSEPRAQDFDVYALDGEWQPVPGVEIVPAVPRLGPQRQRRILVIVKDLVPGQTRTVRVCAQARIQEGPVHARVCSKLVARSVADRGGDPGAGQ